MPLIDDDEFIKICDELENLKQKEKDLQKGYIDLKLENTKIINHKKKTRFNYFCINSPTFIFDCNDV